MKDFKYLITIVGRHVQQDCINFFRDKGVKSIICSLCQGTARDSLLDNFGLEKKDMVMIKTLIPTKERVDILKSLNSEFQLSRAGVGIAFILSVDGIGGKSAMNYLVGEKPQENINIGDDMEKQSDFVLILTIANKGWTELVMDAARKAGATGGTVVKATGTGQEFAKFFGVSISEEKEMIYIVANREKRDAIMQAIMKDAGANSQAHAVTFSLPVENIVGLNLSSNE